MRGHDLRQFLYVTGQIFSGGPAGPSTPALLGPPGRGSLGRGRAQKFKVQKSGHYLRRGWCCDIVYFIGYHVVALILYIYYHMIVYYIRISWVHWLACHMFVNTYGASECLAQEQVKWNGKQIGQAG